MSTARALVAGVVVGLAVAFLAAVGVGMATEAAGSTGHHTCTPDQATAR